MSRKTSAKNKKVKGKIIVFFAFLVGLTACLANATVIASFMKSLFNETFIELTDVSFRGSDTLDIKVQNHGAKEVFLKRISLEIKKKWVLAGGNDSRSYLSPSAIYELVIDTNLKVGDRVEMEISQTIDPNKSDRFLISIGARISAARYFYLVDLLVTYNQAAKNVRKKDILLAFSQSNGLDGQVFTSDDEYYRFCTLDSISLSGAIVSEKSQLLIRNIGENAFIQK